MLDSLKFEKVSNVSESFSMGSLILAEASVIISFFATSIAEYNPIADQ